MSALPILKYYNKDAVAHNQTIGEHLFITFALTAATILIILIILIINYAIKRTGNRPDKRV